MSRIIRIGRRAGLAALLALFVVPSVLPSVASAHERRQVGDLNLVVGFGVEPAFEGQKNAVSLRVTRGEGESASPIEGLEETLQVEVTHVETGLSQSFAMRRVFNDPGHYMSDLLPTAAGQYQFHFTGDVEGTALDEVFISGEGFNSVESSTPLQFPHALPEMRELQAAVTGAQDAAFEAEDAAASARTLAVAGIGAGVVGSVAGLAGVILASRRR